MARGPRFLESGLAPHESSARCWRPADRRRLNRRSKRVTAAQILSGAGGCGAIAECLSERWGPPEQYSADTDNCIRTEATAADLGPGAPMLLSQSWWQGVTRVTAECLRVRRRGHE